MDRAGEGLRLRSRPQAAPLNRLFAGSAPPPAAGGQVQGGGSAPTSPPSRASGATLGRLAPELGEPSGCAARRWGLSISRIDKLPLGEGRAVSPRRRVTQGNLSRKNPLPAESRAGAGRAAAPARSRAPAPRGSPALPPPARPAVPPCSSLWADGRGMPPRTHPASGERGPAGAGKGLGAGAGGGELARWRRSQRKSRVTGETKRRARHSDTGRQRARLPRARTDCPLPETQALRSAPSPS